MDYNNNYQPPYNAPQPPYNAPQPPKSVGGAALTCGILSVVAPWFVNLIVLGELSLSNVEESLATIVISYLIALTLGIVAITLGSKGMKEGRMTGAPKGMAVGGLVTGIIGTVIAGLNLLCSVVMGSSF